MAKRRLLIISYVFPPAGGITVQRALSLAKYLPACGFEVHVLTAGNAASPVYDPGLLKHIPAEVTVHRSFTPELPFYFRKKLWALFSGSKNGAGGGKAAGSVSDFRAEVAGDRVDPAGFLSPDPQVVWMPFAMRRAAALIRKHRIEYVLTDSFFGVSDR